MTQSNENDLQSVLKHRRISKLFNDKYLDIYYGKSIFILMSTFQKVCKYEEPVSGRGGPQNWNYFLCFYVYLKGI